MTTPVKTLKELIDDRIDFLGSLAIPKEELPEHAKQSKGLERKSTTGSKWYIRTYLGVVRSVYSSASVDDLIYKTLRCGQVHEGIVKRGVLIGTEMPNNHRWQRHGLVLPFSA